MNTSEFPKVTVILRGYTESQVRTVVSVLAKSSIRSVEITMNSENAVEIIRKMAEEFGGEVLVGAGTVTTLAQAVAAVEAGAKFILSPVMLDLEILHYCKEKGVVTVPGALSVTEIFKSFRDGADIVKVFPAAVLGSKYLKDIAAPLGTMPLMVVGGINTDNVREYFDAGAQFAGIGSGIFNKEDILQENVSGLEASLRRFEIQLNGR